MSPWGWLFLARVEILPNGVFRLSAFKWAEEVGRWFRSKRVEGRLLDIIERSHFDHGA